MFRLRLLGGIALEGPDGFVTGRAAQRRRLAILTLLALAPGRALSRDKLMALLWPEASADEARHRLSVALYELRRALGEAAPVTRGENVCLDPALLAVDVASFEEAAAAGDAERAARCYTGPFLDGVHLADSPAFEEWAAGVRERLERAHRGVLETIAAERARSGDRAGAANMWRQVARAEPYSGRVALELMRALDAAGDRVDAVRHAAAHAALLRAELGIEPDPEVEELARAFRTTSLDTAPEAVATVALKRTPATAPEPHTAGLERDGTAAALSVRGRRTRYMRGVAATVVLVAGVSALGLLRAGGGAPRAADAHRVAVLPFMVSGAAELAYLGTGVSDLLSTALDGAGSLRAVDPHAVHAHLERAGATPERAGPELARRFGARHYVLGSVISTGGRLRIRAGLYEPRRAGAEAVARATAEGPLDDALALVDELAAQLIAQIATSPGERPVRVAAMTTHALPALKAYLAGEALYRTGAFVAAADSFRVATERDSTFALAHYRLALASLWADREGVSVDDADARALRHSGRLGERDRLLVRAYTAWRRGDAYAAETVYRSIVAAYPDDVEAWFQLAETLFHYNPLRGRGIAEARPAFERVLRLDPGHRGAAWHLALLAAHRRDASEFRRLTSLVLALPQDAQARSEVAALRTLALARGDGFDAVAGELRSVTPLRRSTLAWRAAVYLGRWADAERVLELSAEEPSSYWRDQAALERATLQLAAGRWRAADATLNGLTTTDARVPGLILELRALALTLPPTLRDTSRDFLPGPPDPGIPIEGRTFLTGLLAAADGDTATLRAHALELDRLAARSAEPDLVRSYAATLRAHLLRAAGRPADALAQLDSQPLHRWYGWAVTSSLQAMTHARFLRAELLVEVGRDREALAWFASFEEHALHDLIYLAAAHYRRGQIHERLGDRRAAAREYARVLELWTDADPELQPLVLAARERRLGLGGARLALRP